MSAGLHRRPGAIDNDLSIAAKNARAPRRGLGEAVEEGSSGVRGRD